MMTITCIALRGSGMRKHDYSDHTENNRRTPNPPEGISSGSCPEKWLKLARLISLFHVVNLLLV